MEGIIAKETEIMDARPVQHGETHPVAEFDDRLWPIFTLIVLMAGAGVALVITGGDFPPPLSLNWLSAEAYQTGWGGLCFVLILCTVAIGSVMGLQRVMARRVLFCVFFGLCLHLVMGIYLHNQYLAVLIQQTLQESDDPSDAEDATTTPDYYWETIDQPEDVRREFETPLTTEDAEMAEALEIERRESDVSLALEMESRSIEVERPAREMEAWEAQLRELEQEHQPMARNTPRTVSQSTPTREAPSLQENMQVPTPLQETPIENLTPITTSPDIQRTPEQPTLSPAQLPRAMRTEVQLAEARLTTPTTVSAVTQPKVDPLERTPDFGLREPFERTSPRLDPLAGMAMPAHIGEAFDTAEPTPTAPNATPTPYEPNDSRIVVERSTPREGSPFDTVPSAVAPPSATAYRSSNTQASRSTAQMARLTPPTNATQASGSNAASQAIAEAMSPGFGSTGRTSAPAREVGAFHLPGSLPQTAGANAGTTGGATAATGPSQGSTGGDSPYSPGSATPAGAIGRSEMAPSWSGTPSLGGSSTDTATAMRESRSTGDWDGPAGAVRPGQGDRDRTIAMSGLSSMTRVPRSVPRGLPTTTPGPRIADIPGEAFWHRQPETREQLAIEHGGSPETEQAVERGLAYLARQQFPDGRWALDRYPNAHTEEYVYGAPGNMNADTAATGLALLAFLGAGYDHRDGTYATTVARGLHWLAQNQGPDGRLYSNQTDLTPFARNYGHGIASIAVCEAYDMTDDEWLKLPSEKAVAFIVSSQHPSLGGWRYEPRIESDTSVSGWQLMALTAARLGGIDVPEETLAGVRNWLNTASRFEGQRYDSSVYAYNPFAKDDAQQRHGRLPNLPMTAEGLLMRIYLGEPPNSPQHRQGVAYLEQNLPTMGDIEDPKRDVYYWYLATQVMFQMQGDPWQSWNARLRPHLLAGQEMQGELAGSWSPNDPLPDQWADEGGRHYVTTMHILMLEVYYRYLPLYDMLGD
jgi:hypothetical protein